MYSDLKIQVEKVYGMPIKYGNQCQELSLFIFEQTEEYISFQTLRRFFGFIDQNKKPTIKTLNILSRLCGCYHYDDFMHRISNNKTENIFNLIYTIPIRKEQDLNFHFVCRNFAHYFYNNLNILSDNLPNLLTSKLTLEYLFERFPYIDHINNEKYKRALKLYTKIKGTKDAHIFTETLLYLGNYLKTGKAGKITENLVLSNLSNLHPFLQARLIGTLLIYKGKNNKEIVKIVFDFEKRQNQDLNSEFHFPFFNFMMADYFIICKMYEEARRIIELSYNINLKPTGWLEIGYFESFELLYSIALAGLGETVKAEEKFKKIDRSHFHFIFNKYYSIQYLLLKKKLKGKLAVHEQDELKGLYADTKFSFI